MNDIVKASAVAIGLATAALAAPAFGDGSYVGPNGGTASWQGECYSGPYRVACHRDWTATTPNGNTYSGGATAYSGPWRYGATRHITGPEGNTAYGVRQRVAGSRALTQADGRGFLGGPAQRGNDA